MRIWNCPLGGAVTTPWPGVMVAGSIGREGIAIRTTRNGTVGWRYSTRVRDGLISDSKLEARLLEVTADSSGQLVFTDASRAQQSQTLVAYDDLLVEDDEAEVLQSQRSAVVEGARKAASECGSLLVVLMDGIVEDAFYPIEGGWLAGASTCGLLPAWPGGDTGVLEP